MKCFLVLVGLVAYAQAQSTVPVTTAAQASTVAQATTARVVGPAVHCTGASQCHGGTCCVENRKRFILDSLFGTKGTCRPTSTLGQPCHNVEIHGLFTHGVWKYGCPCQTGLRCQGGTSVAAGTCAQ